MKIGIAQLEIEPACARQNYQKAITAIKKFEGKDLDLIIFPEMLIPGYILGDFWERVSFLKEVEHWQNLLIEASRSTAIAFGGLGCDWNKIGEDGRVRKYNSLFVAQEGKLCPPTNSPYPYSIKTLLPNYREFDDSRHFYDTRKLALETNTPLKDLINTHTISLKNKQSLSIGALLCEDGWHEDYNINPPQILASKGAELIINLSCSPYTFGKRNKRTRVFEQQAADLNIDILYCNCTGIQNNGKTLYTFDGDSTFYSKTGKRQLNLNPFEEDYPIIDTNSYNSPVVKPQDNTKELLKALLYGTEKFLEMTTINKVVIGISGGIDSALAAALYAKIIQPENLLLINMPSEFNTKLTKSAAYKLAKNIGCYYCCVPIQDSFEHTLEQLDSIQLEHLNSGNHLKLNIAQHVKENIQARDRSGRILAAFAAAFGGAFTCNANKSETTVGYSTLYGDHAGFLANLADLWKEQVYDVSKEINNEAGYDLIPQEILDVPPSAELSADQNPEAGKGDPFHYPYHDKLFRSWVEDWNRKSPEEILEWYLEGKLEEKLGLATNLISQLFPTAQDFIFDLERWWKCYTGLGVAKRIQAPPILAVTRRAFGFDHREAQTPIFWTERYLKLKDKALAFKAKT